VAVTLGDAALVAAREKLATEAGLSMETSSAAAFAAVDSLAADKIIAPEDDVVTILTASGLKDFGLDGIPQLSAVDVEPKVDAVLRTLDEEYGYSV
jgi:threonine synthase